MTIKFEKIWAECKFCRHRMATDVPPGQGPLRDDCPTCEKDKAMVRISLYEPNLPSLAK